MEAIPKIILVAVAFYLGGVAGFLFGYVTNASLLRSYRDEAEDLRWELGRRPPVRSKQPSTAKAAPVLPFCLPAARTHHTT